MVSAEGQPGLFARGREFLHHIAAKGRIHDIEFGLFRIPEAETVVVFGGEHVHYACFRSLHPGVSIELSGVEPGVELVAFSMPRHSRPAISWPVRERGPVDEHPKTCFCHHQPDPLHFPEPG
jgi:hypothetical protein